GGRIHRPRTIIECQHHLLVAEEVQLLEVLEAEAGTAGGIDRDDARDTKGIWIGAIGFERSGRRWWSLGCWWSGWGGRGGLLLSGLCRSWKKRLRPGAIECR